MNWHGLGLVVAASSLTLLGCSDDGDSDPADKLYGDWDTGELILRYNPDGSWGAIEFSEEEPFDTGSFTFDGKMLTFTTNEGSTGCAGGDSGSYEATFVDEDHLALKRVEDDCMLRAGDFASGLVRVDE